MQKIYRIGKYQFEYREKITYDADFPYVPHFHDAYELYLFKQGEGYYMVEGKKYPLRSGDLLITNPRELHCPFISSDVYHRITISIHPLYLSSFITNTYNPFSGLASRPLAMQNRIAADTVRAHGLDKEISIIGSYYTDSRPSSDAMIKAHLLILLEAINQIVSVSKLSFAHERIQEIVHFINDHLAEKITLSSIANTFFINKNYLSNTFHDHMGMTLTDYITSKRIQNALELLSEPDSLLDIALRVGFTDYAGFYRAFTKVTGLSPQNYRKAPPRKKMITEKKE